MADPKNPKDTSVDPMTTENSPGLTGGQKGQSQNQNQGQGKDPGQQKGGGATFDVMHHKTGEKRTVTEEQYRNENLEEQGFRKPGRL